MCDENRTNCLCDILSVILKLQKQGQMVDDIPSSCDKPFLGPCINNGCYNTRPITLYCCRNNSLWTMPYTLDGVEATSSIFRIEALDCNCATFRVLRTVVPTDPDSDTTYAATDSFFTINVNCIGAIQCLEDTFVSCI